TLAALVAEELDVALQDVHVEHGPASWAYYNRAGLEDGGPFAKFDKSFIAGITREVMGAAGKMIGLQMTGGSSSAADAFTKMREAGAVARALLLQAAAELSGEPIESLKTKDGNIIAAAGKSIPYGAVAARAAQLTPAGAIKLKLPAEWRYLGKPQA